MPTQIWHGSYGAESPYDVESLRYASTDCEDTNQGYVELLRVLDGPPQFGSYFVHMLISYPAEERSERIVVTLRSREDAEKAFELVSGLCVMQPLMRPQKIFGAIVEYLDGHEIPWVYSPRVPDQLSLL